jgi:hypothetical protein
MDQQGRVEKGGADLAGTCGGNFLENLRRKAACPAFEKGQQCKGCDEMKTKERQ